MLRGVCLCASFVTHALARKFQRPGPTAMHVPVATLGAVAVAAAVASGAPVPVAVSLGLSIVGYKLTSSFLSSNFVREAFIKARLVGVDLNKPTTKRDAAGNLVRPVDGALVPEAAGVLAGTVYLVCMFVFIPVRSSPALAPA